MDDVTIILPTYNRRHVLERTIACYRALARRWPLMVIDDGSTDGTTCWLRSLGLRVVRSPVHRSLPSVRNHGLRLATTEWVLFGEDDVLFPEEHVDRLRAAAKRLPRCAAVCGRLHPALEWTLPEQEPSARPGPLLDHELWLGHFDAAIPSPRPLPSLHACALIHRERALACGGYDPSYRASAFREESELYARLWHAGWACWWTPETWSIHIRHRQGGGARGQRGMLPKLANRWSYWLNNARYVDRHWRLWQAFDAVGTPGQQKWLWGRRILAEALRAGRTRGAAR